MRGGRVGPAEWEAFAKRYVLVPEDEYQARIEERRSQQ